MADKKISALTGASTPLAGTEVLPIVQSGSTVKVAVSDLTVGRAVSMASVTASNLTSGRVATVGASGLIQDDADLQFNGQDLGVGTAPKTWAAADFYGLQVGKGIAIFGRGSSDQDRGGFTSNAYNDGSWKRIATGNAAQYYQNDGSHTFYTAVSGAADSAISWVEVAEIDEANKNFKVTAGNLIIGTSDKGISSGVSNGTLNVDTNGTGPIATSYTYRQFMKRGAISSTTFSATLAFVSQGTSWSNHVIEFMAVAQAGSASTRYGGLIRYIVASLDSGSALQGPTALASDLSGLTASTSISGNSFTVTFTAGATLNNYSIYARVLTSYGGGVPTAMS